MLNFLYNVFITPIESLVEFIFYFMNKIFPGQPAYSIVFVSLAINLLILPLYKRADDMQERERAKVQSMERWNKHIKKTFKGDERYMMQSAYYRIEGYKPIYAVTGSLSLLFQIPFFIAAYHFLSNLDLLNGVGFFLIKDLGAEDGIIKVGGLAINLLPVLMTAINIVSGMIYTKGFKLKDKVQLYAMALIFLVLLYKSPAGLVLYWTLNNLFSLLKNVFFKIVKHKRLAINIISAAAGTFLFFTLYVSGKLVVRRQYLVFGLIMILSYLPAVLSLMDRVAGKFKEKIAKKLEEKESQNTDRIFWLGAVLNTLLLGIMIPAELIGSSPVEFGTLVHDTPLSLVFNTFSIYLGLFIVWIGIFFAISGKVGKKIFAYGVWVVGVCSLVNYYFFFGKFGRMDYLLKFEEVPVYNDLGKLINFGVLLIVGVFLVLFAVKWSKAVKNVLVILIMMTGILSAMSMIKTHNNLVDEGYFEVKKDNTIVPTVSLSKDDKNIVVIMLDRAINEYIPYIFQEKPDIAEQFEDFVYYPNTISFGGCTNFAAPAVFGGYEYTPAEMNKRDTELLVDKNNEALKMLPVLFGENGFDVNVVNPPYANYKEYPDTSLFDGYENIHSYATQDKYSDYVYHSEAEEKAQKKHVAVYSLFRTLPVLLQNSVYDEGNYLGKPSNSNGSDNFVYCAEGYALFDHLDEYAYVEPKGKGSLLVLSSLLTHEPTILELPDYTIGPNVPSVPYDSELQSQYVIDDKMLYMRDDFGVGSYHVNVVAYKFLGEYFDYLKKQGAYDNTRIIIVSDHGWPMLQMDDVTLDQDTWTETFNPVLLVKDFAGSDALSQGDVWYMEEADLQVCDTLMTNADVASLCVADVIENPINPFTGKEINSAAKEDMPLLISSSRLFDVGSNNGTVFDTSDYPWVEFSGRDVKDKNNWKILYDE